METNEVVSIIIPIYNVEAYLRQCLETVIHQTYPHLEIILVNDGSPDQSGRRKHGNQRQNFLGRMRASATFAKKMGAYLLPGIQGLS